MRSTTVPRPALYRVSALVLFSALPLLFFPASGQGPGKADKADLVRAKQLMAEQRWAAARGAFDAVGKAISDHGRPEVRQALRGAVTCSLKLGDWKGAWERTQTFWRNRTGGEYKGAWGLNYERYSEKQHLPWIVANLELVRELIIELGLAAKPELRHELERKRIDVDWHLTQRLLGTYFDETNGPAPFPDWWWDPHGPGEIGIVNSNHGWISSPHDGIPIGPDGRPRFLSAPKEYRSAGRRGEKVLALLNELESLDPTTAKEHAARALLTQARIRKTLYGPSSEAAWNSAEFHYAFNRRPSFVRSNNGRGIKPNWELRDNEARTPVAGLSQVIELPQAENPLALLRLLERKYPNSPSVPEAIYLRGVYYQMRQQFDRALSEYRVLRTRYPKHPRAALAQKKIDAIEHPDVLLGRTGFYPAGTRPKLWFAHRKTERVEFTARSFDLPRYLDKEGRKIRSAGALNDIAWDVLTWRDPDDAEGSEKRKRQLAGYFGKDIIRWSAKVPRSERVTTEAVEAPLTSVGVYIVEASVPGRKQPCRALVILSDLALVRKSVPGKSLIYVADSRTGRPVAGQTVLFHTEKDRAWLETTKKSNREGVIEISLKSDSYRVTAQALSAKGGLAVVHFNAEHSAHDDKPPKIETQEVACRVTDRPVYRPGDTVRFRLWVREMADGTYLQPRESARDRSDRRSEGKRSSHAGPAYRRHGRCCRRICFESRGGPRRLFHQYRSEAGMVSGIAGGLPRRDVQEAGVRGEGRAPGEAGAAWEPYTRARQRALLLRRRSPRRSRPLSGLQPR